METKRKLLHSVHVNFRLCHNLATTKQLKAVAHLLAEEGYYPSPAKGDEPLYKAPDIDSLVDERYAELDPYDKGLGGLLRRAGFPLLITDYPVQEDIWCACGWSVFKGEHVKFEVIGGVWAYSEKQAIYQEPFAQQLLALAQKVYPVVRPTHVSITDPDFDSQPMNDSQISKLKITTLGWVDIFASDYVNKYGKTTLMQIPGHSVQELSDGGILYQSRPGIMVEDNKVHQKWQKDASGYLANYGVKLTFGAYR